MIVHICIIQGAVLMQDNFFAHRAAKNME